MKRHIQCSVCRNKQKIEEISYINTEKTVTDEDTKEINGNYSTKIEAVVKLLIKLKSEDSNVKVLIFSLWVLILKCLNEALEENKIKCQLLHSCSLENKIENFKVRLLLL